MHKALRDHEREHRHSGGRCGGSRIWLRGDRLFRLFKAELQNVLYPFHKADGGRREFKRHHFAEGDPAVSGTEADGGVFGQPFQRGDHFNGKEVRDKRGKEKLLFGDVSGMPCAHVAEDEAGHRDPGGGAGKQKILRRRRYPAQDGDQAGDLRRAGGKGKPCGGGGQAEGL